MTSSLPSEALSSSRVANVYTHLREQIVRGRFKPGVLLPTQRQLSEQYKVSVGTASVAMTRLAHDGLIVRRRGQGSFVNPNPAKLGAIRTINFLRPREMTGIRQRAADLAIIESFAQACEQKQSVPVWHHLTEEALAKTEEVLARLGNAATVAVKGVPPELLRRLYREGVPVVAVFPRVMGSPLPAMPYPQISYDRRGTSQMALEHLTGVGYRRIAFIGRVSSPDRTCGFLEAVQKSELGIPTDWVRESHCDTLEDVRDWLTALLRRPDRPEALCCVTDHVAGLVERWILATGLRIPEDLAIIACDDSPEALDAPVRLSATSVRLEEVCRSALEILESWEPVATAEPLPTQKPVLAPLRLTIRDSCGAKLRDRP